MDINAKNIGQIIDKNEGTINQNIYLQNKSEALPLSIASAKGFVGRESYLQELREWYISGTRVFVLHGLGGVGKTALAQKVAEIIKNQYDTHIYLDLQGVSEKPLSTNDAMLQILREFDPDIPDDIALEKLQKQYVARLNQYRILLLLDNAKDNQQIEPLNKSNNSCLLVTSRESFFLAGGKSQKIEQMSVTDAKALLFSIADEKRFNGYAEELAHLTGYLPMALLPLAALLAQNDMESAAGLVEKYRNRKKRLSLAHPTYRNNLTIFASFDLSYEVLSDEFKDYWRRLAVFPSDFHNGAPAFVWEIESNEAILDAILKKLCQYNLLNGNEETKRYRLHDLARDYLNEKIMENNEDELHLISQRHAEFYIFVVKEANSCIENRNYKDALYYFDLEKINIETGKKWAENFADKNEVAAQLYNDYTLYSPDIIISRLHPRNIIEWQTTALNIASLENNNQDVAISLNNIGIAYRSLGEIKNAINYYKKALQIARKYKFSKIEAEALTNLGIIYCDTGKFENAYAHHEKALQIARQIADLELESRILINAGLTTRRINSIAAVIFYERALEITRFLGNQLDEGICLGNLGKTYIQLRKFNTAIQLLNQALQIVREFNNQENEGLFLGFLGQAYKKTGDSVAANQTLRTSIRILEEMDSPDAGTFRRTLRET